jgi:hypothetical protein
MSAILIGWGNDHSELANNERTKAGNDPVMAPAFSIFAHPGEMCKSVKTKNSFSVSSQFWSKSGCLFYPVDDDHSFLW